MKVVTTRDLVSLLLIAGVGAATFACKPRRTDSGLSEGDAGGGGDAASGLKDFAMEPTGGITRKLAARLSAADVPQAGCAHASRYVITGSPGRKKTSWGQYRGDLVGSIGYALKYKAVGWDRLEEWVTLPTYSFLACKGKTNDFPKGSEIPTEALSALKARAEALKAHGLKLHFVVAAAEEAQIANGVMTAVKETLGSGSVSFKTIELKALAGLEAGAQATVEQLKDFGESDALIIWAYGAAGPIVLHAMAGDAEGATKLRNRTALLMTVASPIGGLLPSVAAEREVTRVFTRITKRFKLIGVQSVDDEVFKAVLRPPNWLHPATRASYLSSTLKSASFALTRSDAQKKGLGDKLNVAHLAAVQDPANMRFFPRIGAGEAAKLGLSDITGQLLLPVYQKFPLSDGMVALEHAVIPTTAVPNGVDARLVGVLRMGHYDLAFPGKDTSGGAGRKLEKLHEVPTLAIVDAALAAAFDAFDKREVAEIEPPYDPVAEAKTRRQEYAARNGVLIKSAYANMCLDVPDLNANIVYAHPCHGGSNQRWFFDRKDGMVSLRSAANPQMCIDAHTGDREKKKGYLYMHPCHLQHNQLFYFGRRPNVVEPLEGMPWGEMHNQLYANSKCLDIDTAERSAPNGNRAGRRLYMHTDCHGGTNQQFVIDVAMPQ